MKYKITHTTSYSYSESVPICHNELHLKPRESPHQACLSHRLSITPPPLAIGERLDYFGNELSFFSIDESHRQLTVTANSEVNVKPIAAPIQADSSAWENIRDQLRIDPSPPGISVKQFVFESPAVPFVQEFVEYALHSFPAGRPMLQGVLDLTSRIHTDFEYDPAATDLHTPLDEVFRLRRGVCQDFAHFEIACLRGLGLAARYVSGYLLTEPPHGSSRLIGADKSHAWVSVYCGPLGWVDIDPTNNVVTTDEHITLAWGRDYSDVSPIKGVFVGGGEHTMTIAVNVVPA